MTIAQLKRAVAAHYNISIEDLMGPSRKPIYALPRMVVYYFAALCRYKLSSIGRSMNRDPTSILNGVRRIESLIIENGSFGAGVVKLKYKIIPEANLQGEM